MPSALFALYQDLASIRDHVVSRDDPMRPFRGKPVEVFIKAVSASGPRGLRAGNYEMGDCPYSQRVLIAMEELGIPHRIVPIDTHHKPGWFHLMSGESLVPVIFTDGTLVSGSRHIMSYLIDKYPRRAQGALGPSCAGGLRVGTMAYTRFYPLFQSALRGAPGAVTALQDELKELNATMMAIQAKPGREGVLLGGRTFSREDTSIAPLLHALDVAGPALKEGCGIPDGCDALKEYLAASRSIPSFAKCVPRNEVTIDGYRALLGTKTRAAPCRPWMSDMLE
jgi:glutathione S-transferase